MCASNLKFHTQIASSNTAVSIGYILYKKFNIVSFLLFKLVGIILSKKEK